MKKFLNQFKTYFVCCCFLGTNVYASTAFVATTVDVLNVGSKICKSPWLKTTPWTLVGGVAVGAALSYTAEHLSDAYLNKTKEVKVTVLPPGPNAFPDEGGGKGGNDGKLAPGMDGILNGTGNSVSKPAWNPDGLERDDWWQSIRVEPELVKNNIRYFSKVISGEVSTSNIKNSSDRQLLSNLGIKESEIRSTMLFIEHSKKQNCGGSDDDPILRRLETLEGRLYAIMPKTNVPKYKIPKNNNSSRAVQ
ncbi:MAG: hypothetical protein HOO06_14685 [Bdellovibrionaceae bacterium]|nr:hypothetical protein [Pseudobdellovibrionaceae bacterium]